MRKSKLDPLLTETLEQAFQRFTTRPEERYCDFKFVPQSKFVLDKNRFITAQCSRRAGKSNGLALRFLQTLEKHPGSFCPYIALTRESARNIMWPVLQEQDAKYRVGCLFTESNLTMTHPNGARLQLFGADMKNFIRRLKGIKTPGAGIDEAQDFGGHLETLVDDVLTPTLTDYEDSWLAITGTPGPVPKGYFYEITAESKYGFSQHKWTLLENPYLPNAAQFIEEIKKKRNWDNMNPTLRREWYNEWVLDLESLLLKYNPEINHYNALPPAKYVHLLGVDIGFNDSDALSLLGWSESTPKIYQIEEKVTAKQGITELVHQIEYFRNKYDISKIVMDTGGLGKKIAEEIIRRFQIPIVAADKTRKMENAALLNDYLMRGHFLAPKDSLFAKATYQTQIDWEASTPDRIVLKGHCPDIVDATLYAFKESPAYTWQPEIKKAKWGDPGWHDEQTAEMEQKAQEYWEAQEQAESGFGWESF